MKKHQKIVPNSLFFLATCRQLHNQHQYQVPAPASFLLASSKEETLKKHTNTKHPSVNNEYVGENKFYCHECNMSFKTKKSFKKHEATHNDTEKLKGCDFCHKKFKRQNGLDEHVSLNHKMSSDNSRIGCIHCTGTEEEVCDGCLDKWIEN